MKRILIILPLLFFPLAAAAQGTAQLRSALNTYFRQYRLEGYVPHDPARLDSLRVDARRRALHIYPSEPFYGQPLTPERVEAIYAAVRSRLPEPYNDYRLTIYGKHSTPIEQLVPNLLRRADRDASRLWGRTRYDGRPWVTNASRPYAVTRGLQGRHLMVTPSHGRYYRDGRWRWQRPALFGSREDLLTLSIVNPYLLPMLERAGAVVSSARERDFQTHEAVVDNDRPVSEGTYVEDEADDFAWRTVCGAAGFAHPAGALTDSVQPFRLGTAREVNATSRRSRHATATWTPLVPEEGRYAVYVSYATRPNSVPDAHYTVYHKGGRTQFRVNQRMGGGTWVYLGTFAFDAGCNREGRVVLTNESTSRGVVTADAVRIGGGMGQSARGTAGTSGLPRALEGARYYAQWAGLPDTLFNKDGGENDYNDDIRSRSYLLNYVGGGSAYMPGTAGLGVPYELALALHTDAGVRHDNSVYGTMSICTTVDAFGQHDYVSGLSRHASTDLASLLQREVARQLTEGLGLEWVTRERWDRNYGETRVPDVPAVIVEALSHQNFTDMAYAYDPTFQFHLARALYKGVLRYVTHQHGRSECVVQPLPVQALAAVVAPDGASAELSWQPTADPLEPTAKPTDYVLYTRVDDGDFDNGQLVGSHPHVRVSISQGRRYDFRVAAVNAGGESFPSEVASVYSAPGARGHVLMVNAFERLSGPARHVAEGSVGFDFDEDLGVPFGQTPIFSGAQLNYDPASPATSDENTWGHSGSEMAGRIVAGNTFDYPALHGRSIAAAVAYSYSTCSVEALRQGTVRLDGFSAVDYIAGLQRDVPHNLRRYKTFDAATQRALTDYMERGGRLLVSGAFIGSDMQAPDERAFTRSVLHYDGGGTARADTSSYVRGLGLRFSIHRAASGLSYGVPAPDVLQPVGDGAFCAFAYDGGLSAGCAYAGTAGSRVLAMGFPFESIVDPAVRDAAMGAILRFLLE